MKQSQDFSKESIIVRTAALLAGKAYFSRMEFESIQCDMADNSHVFRRVIFPYPACNPHGRSYPGTSAMSSQCPNEPLPLWQMFSRRAEKKCKIFVPALYFLQWLPLKAPFPGCSVYSIPHRKSIQERSVVK